MTLDDLAALEKAAELAPWSITEVVNGLAIRDRNSAFIAAMRNHARALIQIASYTKSLLSEEGAFDAISHFNVAFGLKEALDRLDEVQK